MTRKAAMTEEVLRQMNVAYDETRERLRQAEADRDAYAAVAKAALKREASLRRIVDELYPSSAVRIAAQRWAHISPKDPLDALTPEQKERIT